MLGRGTTIVGLGTAVILAANWATMAASEAAPGFGRGGMSFHRGVAARMPLVRPIPHRPFFAARFNRRFFAARFDRRAWLAAPFYGGGLVTSGGTYDATPSLDAPDLGPPAMAGIRAAPVGQPTVYVIERTAGDSSRSGRSGVLTVPGQADSVNEAASDSTALRVVTVRVP